MRTAAYFVLIGLAACHQTLPPQDDEGGSSSTGNSSITMPPQPTSTGDESSTGTTPTSGDGSSSTGTTADTTGTSVPVTSTGETTESTSTGTSTGGTTTDSTGGTTSVAVCGDGVVEGDEACDDGVANSDVLQGACRTTCEAAGCGDGVVDFVLTEACDDGNAGDGDGCSAGCAVEAPAKCGDGVVDIADGEACDDGDLSDGDGCSSACTYEVASAMCGDGGPDGLEVCDDGNLDNGDGCNPTCSLKNTTTLFVGTAGVAGTSDGVGPAAKISGLGAMVIVGGSLYLADGTNDSVRRIDLATGTVVTIAGSIMGTMGYADNANGLMARFNDVQAITSDGTILYVGDRLNRRLRGVSLTPPHATTPLAGNGQQLSVDGFGAAASFDDIRGLTWFKGQVYMVDAAAAVLRRYDPATQEVSTIAGAAYEKSSVDGVGAAARFTGPRHMTGDSSGLLFISDSDGFKVRTYNVATGYVGTLAGTGVKGYVDGELATTQLTRPRGLVSDGSSVYFGEFDQHTLRQVVLATQATSTNLGQDCDGMPMCMGGYIEGTGTAAQLSAPFEVVYDHPGRAMYVLDSGNKVIRKIQ